MREEKWPADDERKGEEGCRGERPNRIEIDGTLPVRHAESEIPQNSLFSLLFFLLL
jgi:hypothetical protein